MLLGECQLLEEPSSQVCVGLAGSTSLNPSPVQKGLVGLLAAKLCDARVSKVTSVACLTKIATHVTVKQHQTLNRAEFQVARDASSLCVGPHGCPQRKHRDTNCLHKQLEQKDVYHTKCFDALECKSAEYVL